MALRLSTGLRNKQLGINVEKVTDGTMTTDLLAQAAWTESAATMLGGVTFDAVPTMSLTGADGYAAQAVDVQPGHWYRFSFKWGKTGTTDSAEVKIGTSADNAAYYSYTSATAEQLTLAAVGAAATVTDTVVFQVPTGVSTIYITLGINGATDIAYFDDVSCISMGRSIQDIFETGQILIYSGTQPTSPNDAPTGTLLVTIDSNVGDGTGITFDDAAAGVLTKAAAETWSGICGADGTAGWARLLTESDGGASSTTDERIDMAVATSGAQLNFSSTAFASGATQTITSLSITLPVS